MNVAMDLDEQPMPLGPLFIALDNAPILWDAIGLKWFVMTCYGPKSEFADVHTACSGSG